ncbi:aminoglycoside 6-adenylyltransferase [Exiguobacterium flavidum]|uniref:aminoglycoside 6-adenylyltransferase n=1 Tax=Exiguobacterium flavidum TaxID=2184695 RepID=UPI000DF831F7|nr:aminoglycoside 6-adenylyltransferase [Exiguobacterium flavidum]
MYTVEERDTYYTKTIQMIESVEQVEGIVRIGSGVAGYKDLYSDIDLMVAVHSGEESEAAKNAIRQSLDAFKPVYVKEKLFKANVFLLIVFLEDGLEFNISIVPTELLSVRSPLHQVVSDKTGRVSEKMHEEDEMFRGQPDRYETGDIVFEFAFASLALRKELRRDNLIYPLRLLEKMREYASMIQVLNEGKKLHQFKAYETLDPEFIQSYLATYPSEITRKSLEDAVSLVERLFIETVGRSDTFTLDDDLEKVLQG